MNERIDQLLIKAGAYFSSEGVDYSNFDPKKFAELLVNDVLAILADKRNFNKCTYTNFDLAQGQCITSELTNKIKEHFKDKQ
jgi:hypothetical protein